MTEDAKQVKDEAEDDLDGPINGLNRKSLNKKELIPKDELDDDDAPLALSKTSKKKSSISPSMKKQKIEDDEDEKPLKKKEALKKISKIKSMKNKLDSEEEEDEKQHKTSKKRKRTEVKKEVKMVKKSVSLVKGNNDTKQKKVYELPGQKHDSPDMRDPLRIFYETLYEKVPSSEMAATWLMEWGLLPLEEAQKVHAKKLRKHVYKFGSPAKVIPRKKSSAISVKKEVKVTSNTTIKKIKKKISDSETEEDDDDDDFEFIKKKSGNAKKSANKNKSSNQKASA